MLETTAETNSALEARLAVVEAIEAVVEASEAVVEAKVAVVEAISETVKDNEETVVSRVATRLFKAASVSAKLPRSAKGSVPVALVMEDEIVLLANDSIAEVVVAVAKARSRTERADLVAPA